MATLPFDEAYSKEDYVSSVQHDFSLRASSYNTGRSGLLHKRIMHKLTQKFPPPSSGRILDIACGTGLLTAYITNPSRVTGVDLTPAMLSEARRQFPEACFVEGRADALPFDDDAFDMAYIASALPYFDDVGAAMRETFRVLRSGGQVGIQASNSKSYVLGLCVKAALEDVLKSDDKVENVFPCMHSHTATPTACRTLLEDAGFVRVETETVPEEGEEMQVIRLEDLAEWWDNVAMRNALFGRVRRLEQSVLQEVRAKFVDRMAERADDSGLVKDYVEHVFIRAWKP